MFVEVFWFRRKNGPLGANTNWDDVADFKKLPPGIACCASIACTIPVVVMGMAATWYVGPIALAIAKPYGGDLGTLLLPLPRSPSSRPVADAGLSPCRLRALGRRVSHHVPSLPLRRDPLLWAVEVRSSERLRRRSERARDGQELDGGGRAGRGLSVLLLSMLHHSFLSVELVVSRESRSEQERLVRAFVACGAARCRFLRLAAAEQSKT